MVHQGRTGEGQREGERGGQQGKVSLAPELVSLGPSVRILREFFAANISSPRSLSATEVERRSIGVVPCLHMTLGTGFGKALSSLRGFEGWDFKARLPFSDLPEMPLSSVVGHAGEFELWTKANTSTMERSCRAILFQCGRVHGYEGHPALRAITPVVISRLSGVENFLLSNAAGALDPSFSPGDVMRIKDHVNLTGQNPLVGSPLGLGPRFPSLEDLYSSPVAEALFRETLPQRGLRLHEGTYLGVLGPSFETPAEVRLFSSWGLQAVGMSTVWEAIFLKYSGAQVGGFSLITNWACGLASEPNGGMTPSHEKILEFSQDAASRFLMALFSLRESVWL